MRQLNQIFAVIVHYSILIMMVMMVTGCAPPQSFWGFNEQSKAEWTKAMLHWRTNASISVEHTAGTAGYGSSYSAQSFIPHCEVISAIELCMYPVGNSGWIRVEIARDEQGMPGRVISRCWLRVEKNCPVPHSSYITFPFPRIKVDPEETYWITFNTYVDEQYFSKYRRGGVVGFSHSQEATYQEGKLISRGWEKHQEMWDVKFRVISKCDTVPTLHRAFRSERRTLPLRLYRETPWQSSSINRCEYILKERQYEIVEIVMSFYAPLKFLMTNEEVEQKEVGPDEAIKEARIYLERYPNDKRAATVQHFIAFIYAYHKKDYTQAIKEFDKLIQNYPENESLVAGAHSEKARLQNEIRRVESEKFEHQEEYDEDLEEVVPGDYIDPEDKKEHEEFMKEYELIKKGIDFQNLRPPDTSSYTRLNYVAYNECNLTLQEAEKIALEQHFNRTGKELTESAYLASAKIVKDNTGIYWELTYLLKEPHMHNHMWYRVYSKDNIVFAIER